MSSTYGEDSARHTARPHVQHVSTSLCRHSTIDHRERLSGRGVTNRVRRHSKFLKRTETFVEKPKAFPSDEGSASMPPVIDGANLIGDLAISAGLAGSAVARRR
jgi:hypothetical protein